MWNFQLVCMLLEGGGYVRVAVALEFIMTIFYYEHLNVQTN